MFAMNHWISWTLRKRQRVDTPKSADLDEAAQKKMKGYVSVCVTKDLCIVERCTIELIGQSICWLTLYGILWINLRYAEAEWLIAKLRPAHMMVGPI